MIIAKAKQVLSDAGLRRSSADCERIGRTVMARAEQASGAAFSQARKIVDNRNTIGFRLTDARGEYLLKINKNPASRAVRDAALRMNIIAAGDTGGAFSVPHSHYIDPEFDAALMDFVPGTRLDTLLGQERDPARRAMLIQMSAEALSAIHSLPHDRPSPDGQAELAGLVQDVADALPAFSARNRAGLERLAVQAPVGPVALHGDFSPKNLILNENGTLFVIDFSNRPDSPSPLRDLSIFVIGMAHALARARWLHPPSASASASASPGRAVEPLMRHFLEAYIARSPHIAPTPGALAPQLALFELVRLVETKIWLDGYWAFEEASLGWVKAMLGRFFIAAQLRRLQGRFD